MGISLGIMGLILWVLYGFFPYGQGYGSSAEPVFKLLMWMWDSKNMPEWEHCWLVPFICAGLIYWKRSDLESVSVAGSTRSGAALMFLAAVLYWVGYMIDIVPLSFVSVQVTLGALLVWLFGWGFFRRISFPYLFLFFAWPMPFLESSLAFHLKVLMTQISVGFLNLIGVECLRRGSAIISAANYQYQMPEGFRFMLEVDSACSGIRSLFALMMISALGGYIMMPKAWQRWLLFLLATPLAVAGNFVRILMLTFGTLLFDRDYAIGREGSPSMFHMLSGFVVFGVALAGMLASGWLLNGGWRVVGAVLGLDMLAASAADLCKKAWGAPVK